MPTKTRRKTVKKSTTKSTRPKRKKHNKQKWTEDYYVTAYELAKSGLSDKGIAEVLGVSRVAFRLWKKEKPAFQKALDRGRRKQDGVRTANTFKDYVYDKLSDEAKALWDQLYSMEQENVGVAQIEALLADKGKDMRQQLVLHAITFSNFNLSRALSRVNVPKRTFDKWCAYDPDFANLIEELQWHKKNFFEGALCDLVSDGNSQAVLFANRSLNRDRGYSDKQEIEISGNIDHNHSVTVLDLSKIDLPLDVRKQLLKATREQETQGVIDAVSN